MALYDDEITVHDGQPIELYVFTLPGGVIYRYTDHHTDYTFSSTFTAIPIERSAITVAGVGEPGDITITMPYDRALVSALAFASPARRSTVAILRTHVDSASAGQIWSGPITNVSVRNRVATFRVPRSSEIELQQNVPAIIVQGPCNHVLFDAGCTLAATSFDAATTVSSISSSDARLITVASLGGFTAAEMVAGEIVNDDDGERQLITAATGTVLTVMRPFRSLAATDAVTIYRGCDHSLATCNTDFSNVANFGGFPFVPVSRLFKYGFRGIE